MKAADKAVKGKILAFSNEYLNYSHGKECVNWHYNPVNNETSPRDIPWNKLPDFGKYGDIKLIWEASRFPQVYFFINGYALTQDKKYAQACLGQIQNWVEKNPFPYGVNYKCGQEIAFRLFSWIIAIDYFREFVDEDFLVKVLKNIYTSLLRIDANIDYAAESVRNNHSISEATGLFIGGLLFPQFPKSQYFVRKGIKYLKKELVYQVYKDGSYIQHSMIYHRLVLDILSFVKLIATKSSYKLPEIISQSHRKLLTFMYSFCQENGKIPNYGTNDGSRLFPVAGSNYADFRESLNFAALTSYGKKLFDTETLTAELFGFKATEKLLLERQKTFSDGGYYIMQNNSEDIFLMTRCHSYRHRPGQADMLHLDVWHEGENIFSDSGTYSYNPDGFDGDFSKTSAHNTVNLEDCCQMEKVSKFGFRNWTQSKLIEYTGNSFAGEHYSYIKRFGVTHKRTINCFEKHIVVEDHFQGINSPIKIKQNWNTVFDIEGTGKEFSVSNCRISSDCKGRIEAAYVSKYYNHYEKTNRLIFEAGTSKDFTITTRIDFE